MILQGAANRMERERLIADAAAHYGAQLHSFAVHEPKRMPKFDVEKRTTRRKPPADWRELKSRIMFINAAHGGKAPATWQ